MGSRGSVRSAWAVLMAVVVAVGVAQAADSKCEDRLSGAPQTGLREYPLGVNAAQTPDAHFQYGFEIEYAFSEMAPGLLLAYAPPETMIAKSAWLALTHQERIEWLKPRLDELFATRKKPGLLKKIVNEPQWPEALVLDDTGNLEFITPKPYDSWYDFEQAFDKVWAAFGEGYVQASVSNPSAGIFRDTAHADGYVGMRLFLGQLDTLKKLHKGWEKHLSLPKYAPAKSFQHPYLGPMNSYRASLLYRMVDEHRMDHYDDDVLDRVSSIDASYKYTDNVAYRPDVIRKKDRFINEVRDCVKDPKCLKARVAREKALLGIDMSLFARFRRVPVLDTIADYNLLPADVDEMLKEIFPRRTPVAMLPIETGSEIVAAEVHRNFAFPLQDWRGWLEAMGMGGRPELQIFIEFRDNYVEELGKIASQRSRGRIDNEEAGRRVRLALAKFVYYSRLSDFFENWAVQNVPTYAERSKEWSVE